MKLFLLGGSGLVGNTILKKSLGSFDVISTYNNNKINIPNVRSIRISLPNDFNNLNDLIIKEKPDVVINTIAYSNVDFCESHKQDAYSLHVELTNRVSSICSKINSKLIFISSDYVFDGKKGSYTEDDIPNPVNYYGHTKKLAEELVLRNPKNSVLRTSLIYGWDKQVRFLNYVLNNLRDGKEVLAYEDIFNSPTLIDELVESILKVAETDANGIFHVVGSSCVNRFYFAKVITRSFKMDENLVKPIKIKETQPQAKRPINTCLNNTKARKILGIDFSTIEEGVYEVLKKSRLC